MNRDIEQQLDKEFINLMNGKLAPIVQAKAPDYVYHYTSIDAFLKIIENNTLWFTHMSFQKDPSEVDFGVDVILDILSKNKKDLSPIIDIIKNMRILYNKYAFNLDKNLLFIFSLSEAGDNLPQWVQHGDDSNGICIKFEREHLFNNVAEIMKEYEIRVIHFPVQYYTNNHLKNDNNLKGFEEALLDTYISMSNYIHDEKATNDQNVKIAIYEITKSIASFIKNDFFSNEKEWRLVMPTNRNVTKIYKPGNDDSSKHEDNKNIIIVVPNNHSLKMYLCVPFGKVGQPSPMMMECMQGIQLGPFHTDDQRMSSGIEMAIWNTQKRLYNIAFSNGSLRGRKCP